MKDELSVYAEFYFQWHITERCNRNCKHCYQNGRPSKELPLSNLLHIVDILEKGVSTWGLKGTISLTGGEPFIRKDELHPLMERLDQSNHLVYYDILTSGSCINEDVAATLSSHPHLRRIQLSLEGATAQTNDSIRGEGSFKETLDAIKVLKRAGVDVSVMMTISRINKGEVFDAIRMMGEEGVSTIAFERLVPQGRGSELREYALDPNELRELYQDIYHKALEKSGPRLLLYRPPFCLLNPTDPTVGALCSAGHNALTIMPDGTLYPCRRLPIPLGNILNDGLFKVWYDSDILWKLRNPLNLKGKCRDCELLTQCRGCRAMAYSVSGDFMAEDPQCWK